jgi:hypothetical protein
MDKVTQNQLAHEMQERATVFTSNLRLKGVYIYVEWLSHQPEGVNEIVVQRGTKSRSFPVIGKYSDIEDYIASLKRDDETPAL